MRKTLILAAAAGSAGLLLGALGFQYLGEMPPCKLCYWQRYGHVAALVLALPALALRGAALPLLAGLGAASSAGIGAYHTGVERGWWEGPSSCSSQSIEGLSPEELVEQIMAAPLVRCDEVPWEMLGLSMASWNVLASLGIAALWLLAARAGARAIPA
ncbi:disulfide bond formation protein B [Pseudoponticoccus marisrubri]|uniref:Dihydroneopterin aldolase n=1 Tax=Pseudoponticoccus marisrubri TaxID=1685382 RepID=A0A0W7WMN2_9RHOB|nr:disulfide bond formation protein B [Pseudoponticoccus marisrubri]KUF11845.1 dihydroneopterin aldolase [Pseudoponticoccus marisrubri]